MRGCWVAEAVWITHAGGVGQVIAELMTDGVSRLDLRECDHNRFEPHALSPAYIATRAAQQYREVYDIIHPLQPLEQPRPLRVSPWYARQLALGAVCLESRGWERPQWYAANAPLLEDPDGQAQPARTGWAARFWSPISGAEHRATRAGVALFDMTSLGKVEVWGPGALGFLQRLTTNQVERPVGTITYTPMVDEAGGIVSDITVTRLAGDHFHLGTNGPLDLAWLRRHAPTDDSVMVREITAERCCLGVWGPRARELLAMLTVADLSNAAFPYLTAQHIWVGEVPVLAQRLSYVGELGWELYTAPDHGLRLWDLLWEAGRPLGLIAGGRGAFDSLRLEKGYRLWGVDMHTEFTPDEAGLGFAVKLDKGEFIGRAALTRQRAEGLARRLCCLVLTDPTAVVLGKEPVLDGDRVLGYVTSANYGYSVDESLAYCYLPLDAAAVDTPVAIEYFGRRHAATVAGEPRFDPRNRRLRG
jgi:glycine cleavage system aminomethyltransferase T